MIRWYNTSALAFSKDNSRRITSHSTFYLKNNNMDSEIKIYKFKMVVIFAVVLHFIITKSNNSS